MIRFTLRLPAVHFAGGIGLVGRIRERFQTEAGTMVLDAIRAHLGTSSIYTLSEPYRVQKPRRKGFRRVAGKAGDQPLIFTGELYGNLTAIPHGDTIIIQVEDGAAMGPDGFDYAEKLELAAGYLELGLADVEERLDELLANIIAEEMLL